MTEIERILRNPDVSERVAIMREEIVRDDHGGQVSTYVEREKIKAVVSPGNGSSVEVSGQIVGRADYDMMTYVDTNIRTGDRIVREDGEELDVIAILRITRVIPHMELQLERLE